MEAELVCSCYIPTGIALANFREFKNILVLNKFIRVNNGSEISLFTSLSIFTCIYAIRSHCFI